LDEECVMCDVKEQPGRLEIEIEIGISIVRG
jgi:hypothetical protein